GRLGRFQHSRYVLDDVVRTVYTSVEVPVHLVETPRITGGVIVGAICVAASQVTINGTVVTAAYAHVLCLSIKVVVAIEHRTDRVVRSHQGCLGVCFRLPEGRLSKL